MVSLCLLLVAVLTASAYADDDVEASAGGNASAAAPTVMVQNDVGNVIEIEGVDLAPLGYPTVAEFRGIPYAQPPVGTLRWQPPMALPGWAGNETTLKATEFGNGCMQPAFAYPGLKMDEDCLNLNIVTPKSALESGAKKLPVMLWIHGGAYHVGYNDEPDIRRYPLVSFSKGNIVLVSINYRLGVFGFLCGSEVMESTNGAGCGSFGIQDQRLAMEWVKANIGTFGGDSGAITIFGQSAGGASVIHHLTQPASFPLYHKGIIQSGAYDLSSKTMAEAKEMYEALLTASGCTDLTCLVAKEAEVLVNDAENMSPATQESPRVLDVKDWLPVVDGVSLMDSPSALIGAKRYNSKVPVIIGSMRDETADGSLGPGGPAGWPTNPNLTEAEFDDLDLYSKMEPAELAELKRVYGPETYPYPSDLGDYSSWYWMHTRYTTDRIIAHGACSVRWIAGLLVGGGSTAVYSYVFAHPPKYWGDPFNSMFAIHGRDVAYCFDGLEDFVEVYGVGIPPSEDKKLAQAMAAYWVGFAISKDGNPNPTGNFTTEETAVTWPKFTLEEDVVLRLDVDSTGGIQVQEGMRKAACDWQTEQALAQGVLELNPDGFLVASAGGEPDPPAPSEPFKGAPTASGGNDSSSGALFYPCMSNLLLVGMSSVAVALLV